jgi:hypothetical protein
LRCSFNVQEEAPILVSSPIVKQFDELANAPGSAQERKRRREKLVDQEVLKSAAKNQAVTEVPSGMPNPQYAATYVASPYVQQGYAASPVWGGAVQRPSVGGGVHLPRSALTSPQLFASPERVRKHSDEEKRCNRPRDAFFVR